MSKNTLFIQVPPIVCLLGFILVTTVQSLVFGETLYCSVQYHNISKENTVWRISDRIQ